MAVLESHSWRQTSGSEPATPKSFGLTAGLSANTVRRMASSLRDRVAGEVRFDDESRALYATDASNYRQVPIGAVIPKTIDDVVATIATAREYGAPVLSRGGGTSLAGQCCNIAIVIDYSKYLNRILYLDPARRLARIQPGIILDVLRDAAEQHDLTFGPDPSTHDHNSLGGMLGNNSCGVHSVMAGRTVDNVHALEILTYRGLRMKVGPTSDDELRSLTSNDGPIGEVYRRLVTLRDRYADVIRKRFPQIPRRVSGYNLEALLPENGFNVARALVGSEGTCVGILDATVRLVPSPQCRVLGVLGFDDVFHAGDAVPRILEHHPIGLEAIDNNLVTFMKEKHLETDDLKLLPDGHAWLIAEFGADTPEAATSQAKAMCEALDGRAKGLVETKLVTKPAEQKRIWKVRESGLGGTAFVPHHPDTWEGWEDAAVPPDRVGDYLREFKALLDRYSYQTALYGHFGDGCIHCRINFGLRTADGVKKWREFLDHAADLVVSFGGSISGEHGDGQAKAELLGKMFGPELLQAFKEFKAIWDPDGLMNPGKVVDPYPITSNLRLGPGYEPPQLETHFKFPDDAGNFGHAAIRCVGVGKCRRIESDGEVMCPSYLVTHEEKHTTRGRARLLFEMLHGGAIERSWRNPAVEDALSLCLACKGCKGDCPVNVDMATYKAEFRSHYYAGRLRPRAAYSMGLITWWARLASRIPSVANFLTQKPGIRALVQRAGGLTTKRRMPRFAEQTFVQWRRQHPSANPLGPRVILFPDTFNNFFRPTTAIAATKVLEELGWNVVVPTRSVCCGRPLYDWGMLTTAKSLLREVVEVLRKDLYRGTLIVGLEPACVAAFRDEAVNLFPDDALVQRLAKQTLLLSEFLDQHCQGKALPQLPGEALVQIHCHHHAIMKPDAEQRVLQRMGVDHRILNGGCCGMAGSFGFEVDKFEISMAIAERSLVPTVRGASSATKVLANGFSCREQIEHTTGRKTMHLADAIAMSMELSVQPTSRSRARSAGLLIGVLAATGVAALLLSRRNRAAIVRG